jgi:pyrroline-5-carboxylate reductase
MTHHESVGVIGIGNMASSIVDGMLDAGWDPADIILYDIDERAIEKARRDVDESLRVAEDTTGLAREADVLLLCVHPYQIEDALDPIPTEDVRLASIAAGVELRTLRRHTGENVELIRVMPNLPAQIEYGLSYLAPGSQVSDSFLETVGAIFRAVGKVLVVDEELMDAGTAVSGSGPAYVFYFMEAMISAATYVGFDDEQANDIVTQTFLGSVELARESEKTPGTLRREVSSPGGTTIEALKYMDESGTSGIIQEAVNRSWQKSKRLGRSASE